MVCPTCGASFEGVGNFCPHCGSAVMAAGVPGQGMPPPGYGYGVPAPGYGMPPYGMPLPISVRVQRNLQILAVLWACLAVYRLLSGLAGMFFLRMWSHGGFGHRFPMPPDKIPFLSAMLPFTFVTTVVMVGLSVLVAYGLIQRRPWGRTMSIVMSILSMLKFPFGTALGIYTLWVMAPAASAMEYDAIADRSRPGF